MKQPTDESTPPVIQHKHSKDQKSPIPSADEDLQSAMYDTLAFSRKRDYIGWDYADGLSSKLLSALPVESKWINIAVQETVKRAPTNLRPLFLVEQRRSFKGTALFAMANLNAYALSGTGEFRGEAESLVQWLQNNSSDEVPEFAGYHAHDLQSLDGLHKAGTPGVVSTAYAVQALLAATDVIDKGYFDTALTSADFVFDRLNYEEIRDGARINYKTSDSGSYYTLNANALGARILLELDEYEPTAEFREAATKILDYVVSKQTANGGWMYRDPPTASHLSMDSHHNGFIIETLLRYRQLVDDRFDGALEDSMDFYRETLFESNGAPNWDESASYPRDIHAAAQGIITFAHAGDIAFARRIAQWTLDNLYAGGGRFYFRKQRLYTKRVTLMRWCQAWMAYALSEYLTLAHSRSTQPAESSSVPDGGQF